MYSFNADHCFLLCPWCVCSTCCCLKRGEASRCVCVPRFRAREILCCRAWPSRRVEQSQGHLQQAEEGNKSMSQAKAVTGNYLRIKRRAWVCSVHRQQTELEILKPNGAFPSSGWGSGEARVVTGSRHAAGQVKVSFKQCLLTGRIGELLCELALVESDEIRIAGLWVVFKGFCVRSH